MGQIEVYEWLMKQRKKGNLAFFSTKEIFEGLIKDKVINKDSGWYDTGVIRRCCNKLRDASLLEFAIGGSIKDWLMRYRYKKK